MIYIKISPTQEDEIINPHIVYEAGASGGPPAFSLRTSRPSMKS